MELSLAKVTCRAPTAIVETFRNVQFLSLELNWRLNSIFHIFYACWDVRLWSSETCMCPARHPDNWFHCGTAKSIHLENTDEFFIPVEFEINLHNSGKRNPGFPNSSDTEYLISTAGKLEVLVYSLLYSFCSSKLSWTEMKYSWDRRSVPIGIHRVYLVFALCCKKWFCYAVPRQ